MPIATSGDLSIMPPETGLPSPRSSSSLSSFVDSVPRVNVTNGHTTAEAVDGALANGAEHKPMRYTNHDQDNEAAPAQDAVEPAAESVHG